MTVDLDQLAALARAAQPEVADRTLLAEIRERDLAWTSDGRGNWSPGAHPEGKGRLLLDRRVLLRIVGELEQDAERYQDALEICAADESPADLSAIAINRRNIARHALRAADAAAAEKIGGAG